MAEAVTRGPLRFCYLDCEDAEKWAGHEEGARRILQPGSLWEHYRCYNGELPPMEGLSERFDGILISGSHYSAYEDRPWIRQLEQFLRQAVVQHPRVRILGMCFGCQVLAQALGGRVGKNASGRFVLGVEQMQLLPALQQCTALQLAAADASAADAGGAAGSGGGPCAEKNPADSAGPADSSSSSRGGGGSERGIPGSVRLIESHGDCVLALPPGGVLLAESPTTPIEMWTMPAGNVLAVQGHAELSAEVTLSKIHTAVAAAGRLSAEEAEESARSLREDPHDSQLVIQLYRRFMERGLPEVSAVAQAANGSGTSSSQAAGAHAKEAGAQAAAEGEAGAAAGSEIAQAETETAAAETDTGAASAGVEAEVEAAEAGAAGRSSAPASNGSAAGSADAASEAGGLPVSTSAAAPAPEGGSSAAAAGRGTTAAAATHLLQQLQLAVSAELDKTLSEQQLLRACNEAAATRYQQLGDAAAAARGRLEELAQQKQEQTPLTRALDELEAQVGALEETVVQLDASSRRLQAQLAPPPPAAAHGS